jgi:hypothetical protein
MPLMSAEIHSTVSSKGQIVIPADVRKRMGLTQGSVVRFQINENGECLMSAAGDVRRLKGRIAAPAKPVSLEEMAATIAQRRAKAGQR